MIPVCHMNVFYQFQTPAGPFILSPAVLTVVIVLTALLISAGFFVPLFTTKIMEPNNHVSAATSPNLDEHGGCPFLSTQAASINEGDTKNNQATDLNLGFKNPYEILEDFKVRKSRVIMLYEIYVHLPALQAIWDTPITVSPAMEPYFAAACHGMELCFLLLATFINDSRIYLAKKSRIELVCKDIVSQCQLLAELLDGQLEDVAIEQLNRTSSRINTTSNLPPTMATSDTEEASPGLRLLSEALQTALKTYSDIDRLSLIKLVRTIVTAYQSNFSQLSVGIGIEQQLLKLATIVGIQVDSKINLFARAHCIDYSLLVRPHAAAATLLRENYSHAEDFFFRTIHLGTECWAFIAHSRIEAAKNYASCHHWHQAAEQIRYAASIINYLGDHVLILTSMVIRDYLELKVEIQGTSGEGSLAVKSLRCAVLGLLDPVLKSLIDVESFVNLSNDKEQKLKDIIAYVYDRPESFPGLYNYCKALECIESSLLGGFYYKHFLLAKNVIGSMAKGTMNRSVQALKGAIENSCFPVLDIIRADLGAKKDRELAHNHARIMNKICEQHPAIPSLSVASTNDVASAATSLGSVHAIEGVTEGMLLSTCRQAEKARSTPLSLLMSMKASGVIYRVHPPRSVNQTLSSSTGANNEYNDVIDALSSANEERRYGASSPTPSNGFTKNQMRVKDLSRRALFNDSNLPDHYLRLAQQARYLESSPGTDLHFLYHAWGTIPPKAMASACDKLYATFTMQGNFSWDILFSEFMPTAKSNIQRLLGLDDTASSDISIEFGHNSHELVSRIISTRFDRLLSSHCSTPLRIVTTDAEFYSLTRQLNRFMEANSDRIDIIVVACHPLETFTARFLETVKQTASIDIVYVSHITFLQDTLFDDVHDFSAAIRSVLQPTVDGELEAVIILDGYHSFGSLPISFVTQSAPLDCIFVAGVLKHIGAGPNLAFALIPARYSAFRPFLTGWLADVSVLGATSEGIGMGSSVGYTPGLTLMGSTPAFVSAMVLFNETMNLWDSHAVSVLYAHQHVMQLQRLFIQGLERLDSQNQHNPFINIGRLTRKPFQKSDMISTSLDVACRHTGSHTLVFQQDSVDDAAKAVLLVASHGIAIDNRKRFVRIGFGLSHNPEDIGRLLTALLPMGGRVR